MRVVPLRATLPSPSTVLAAALAVVACTDTGVQEPLGAPAGTGGGAGSAGGGTGGSGAGGTGAGAGGAGVGGLGGGGGVAPSAGGGGSAGSAGASNGAGQGGSSGTTSSGGTAGRATGGGAGSGGSGDAGEGGAAEPNLTSFELVVIGSSTAAGEGASSASRGWVSLLANALDDAALVEVTTTNLARGGYTTVELASGSGADGSIDDALEREPNLVIVSLAGSNDLSAGTSEATFLSRLSELRDTANGAGVPLFFLSTAPKDLSDSEQQALKDWADAMDTAFSSCWVPDRAGDYSPCFVDIFDPLANASLGIDAMYGSGDGIHLNDAGHAAIFELTQAVVVPYVCSRVSCN